MKTILLAEDDQFLSNIFAAKLQAHGFRVIQAFDGEATLEKLKTERPDLILLDLIMPKKDGFEILAAIKATELLKTIPVVILSNLSQDEDIKKTRAMGAVGYLVKSNLTPQELVDRIRAFLRV